MKLIKKVHIYENVVNVENPEILNRNKQIERQKVATELNTLYKNHLVGYSCNSYKQK